MTSTTLELATHMLLSHPDASYATRGGCRPQRNMESPMNPKLISRSRTEGFSTIELLIVVAIAFILAAVAIPQAMGAYRTYKLNDAAVRVAGILKFTRLEAIRRN